MTGGSFATRYGAPGKLIAFIWCLRVPSAGSTDSDAAGIVSAKGGKAREQEWMGRAIEISRILAQMFSQRV